MWSFKGDQQECCMGNVKSEKGEEEKKKREEKRGWQVI